VSIVEEKMPAKNETGMNSLIGEGSMFEGKFFINGSLQIDGRFEGEIKTRDQLIVGSTGRVKTDIVAKRVVVGGTLIGNIDAEEEVQLLSTGKVLGNIRAPRVHIEDGVVVKGEVSISAGPDQDVKKIIEEAFGTGQTLDDLVEPEDDTGDSGDTKGDV
jgi:cytoskeletal protein CcmA (bactofilin family)